MGETVKMFVAGVVGIGLVTAVGIHAKGLSQFVGASGRAGEGFLNTSIKG